MLIARDNRAMPFKDLRNLGLAALLLAVGALVAIAYLSNRTSESLQQAISESDRVRRVLSLNARILDLLRDAETGQRGFLLTGRLDYLDPYHRALQSLPKEMTQLADALSGDTEQLRRLGALQPLVNEKLEEMKQTIDLRRAAGMAPATEVVLSGQGKQIMDRIRQVSRDLEAGESDRLAAVLEARQGRARQTRLLGLLGSALLAILVGGGFFAVRIGEGQRDKLNLELSHARDLLQTTLYSIGDGVIATDAEGKVTFMNRVACDLTGCEETRFRGAPLHEIFHIVNEESGIEVENPAAKVIRDGVMAGLANHTLLVARDGRRIPIDDSAAPIRHNGDMMGVVLVFRDISERRRAEREAAYLAALVESSGDAIVGKTVEGIIQTWNAGAERLYGYRAGEIVGHPAAELIPSDRLHEESDILETLRRGERVEHFETTRLRKGGAPVVVSLTISPIRDTAGKIVGASHVARDITERKTEEARLRDSEARLRAYLESAAQGIIAVDENGRIESMNAKAEELFGYNRTELAGKQLEILLPERFRRAHVGYRAGYFGAPRARPMGAGMELAALRKDGAEFPVEIALSFVASKEGTRAIAFITDITERKLSEDRLLQTQKLESLGVLAGGIAHDFNNLLTGILGNASMALYEVEPDSPAKERMDDVINASERAAQLTRQMLAYSGKGGFFVERIDLSARIRETAPLLNAAIPSTVELRFNFEEHLPAIEADAAQIQQLMMNIIINGAEAIPEGRPGTVTVATSRQDIGESDVRAHHGCRIGELKPGRYILFEVSDTGSGMDEATIARIFDPFFTTKFTGRGLGLAAVHGIVRGHRGCIQVASRPGEGTTFRVLLPAVEEPPAQKPAMERRQTGGLAGCGTILVVDDEEIVRKTARQALERYGCDVLLAENGARGVEIYRREADRIQCVVLDLTMPVMSGEEALAHMKSQRADIPVILSSGYDEVEAVRRFEGKGLAGFLQKPYKAADLAEIVKDVISRSGRK